MANFTVSGDFGELVLTQVIQMMAIGSTDGRLNVDCGEEIGIIHLRKGKICDAEIGSQTGLPAIVAMQVHGRENCWFEADSSALEDQLGMATDVVVLELCRMSDEVDRTRSVLEELIVRSKCDSVYILDETGQSRLHYPADSISDPNLTRHLREAYAESANLFRLAGGNVFPRLQFTDKGHCIDVAPISTQGLLVLVRAADQDDILKTADVDPALVAAERFLAEPLLAGTS
ncbi:MAG: DUF4388 domain-containing protein [Planctomycetota bacterium]